VFWEELVWLTSVYRSVKVIAINVTSIFALLSITGFPNIFWNVDLFLSSDV